MEGDWNRVLRRINSISIRSPDSMTQEDYDRLVAHVQEEYMIPEIKTDWVEVGKAFGLSPKLCSVAYRQQILTRRTKYLESKRGFGSLKAFSGRALNLRSPTRCGMVGYLEKMGMHWTSHDIYKLAIAWNTGFQSLKQDDNSDNDYDDLSTHIGSNHSNLECRKVLAIMCQRQLHFKARMPASQVRAASNDVWTAEEIETVNSMIREQFEQGGRYSQKAFVRQVMSRFPNKDPVSVNSVVELQRRRKRFTFYTNKCREAQARLSRINDEKGKVDEDDFKAVSKAVGLSVYVCRKNYTDQMFVIERKFRLWTKTETELLLESLRDQKKQQQQQSTQAADGKRIGVSWKVAAAHVGTRTSDQCCTKYYTLLRQNPSILLD
ncbi:hypothetical protein IWW48_004012 [Coemansia sp. RSA 1200]|nr:hypothetical protein IWW48_004012 [Coemansia sp. RSA 1200]